MREQVFYAENLPTIPSEFIEPYAQRYMMMQLESIAYGFITPETAKNNLKVVDSFIGAFSGLHAQIATTNEYYRLIHLEDNELVEIAKNIFDISI